MSDIEDRKAALLSFLRSKESDARRHGKLNQRIGIALMIIAIGASAMAGIAGLGSFLSTPKVGAIALLPGFVALLASTIKFDERAKWHYRRKRKMSALVGRLEYELPAIPTEDQIASIHREKSAFDDRLDFEWDETFALNWGWVGANHSPGAKPKAAARRKAHRPPDF